MITWCSYGSPPNNALGLSGKKCFSTAISLIWLKRRLHHISRLWKSPLKSRKSCSAAGMHCWCGRIPNIRRQRMELNWTGESWRQWRTYPEGREKIILSQYWFLVYKRLQIELISTPVCFSPECGIARFKQRKKLHEVATQRIGRDTKWLRPRYCCPDTCTVQNARTFVF